MFCIWNIQRDHIEPFLSKNNFQPPNRPVENGVFHVLGRGNWTSCAQGVLESIQWAKKPWEIVSKAYLESIGSATVADLGKSRGFKTNILDSPDGHSQIVCGSATDLESLEDSSIDLVITDPPFGDIMQYAELSGFFYSWLRLVLRRSHEEFVPNNPPTTLEAVENSDRHGRETNVFYKRLLTASWREAMRVLRPAGVLAFTFHHDKDKPWIAVLESLFEAGFYLEATYPIRSDETKGEGSTPGTFGAQKVEYDVIHVCRKRTEKPQRVSWGRMRREILEDVRQLQTVLEHHIKSGLQAADLRVIRRGKALEYFSRHYGEVYVDETRQLSIKEALVGINQLLDEGSGEVHEQPPSNAEPMTRQLLRLFHKRTELPRDQIQKYLRGTGLTPVDFVDRGWCSEEQKVFHLVPALQIAQEWHGRHKRRLEGRDYDQTMILIGACHDASGINAADTIKNENFKPHPALNNLLDWHVKNGATQTIRNAAARAQHIYQEWERRNPDQVKQMSFFDSE
jgi:putative DNA methylase